MTSSDYLLLAILLIGGYFLIFLLGDMLIEVILRGLGWVVNILWRFCRSWFGRRP